MLSDAVVHPMLPATDIERAKQFYGQVLGLELIETNETVAMYRCGSGTAVMVYPSAHAGTNQATAAEFEVSDVAATKSELEGRGVVFEEYDFEGTITSNGILSLPSGAKAAWFKDTEGNILGLAQLVR